MTSKQLRFAPLIRVSTESQERKGESLRTQREQILRYVKSLRGTIPEHCWTYSGQEHATPDQERRILDELLKDAPHGLFDAVIVCDASRWSRDNRRSKVGLDILMKNSIRFFVGTVEYDLYSPEQRLFLGMATEINEFYAASQNLKSHIQL
jgi:DNA invertase Pin-like site-specific DNA recombinase